ncbi:SDR family oxidoreductase [Microbacterium sp. RU33B]|uniref:SDR family oxidoreductase n=1 Tax=Microbacterium sp. RU33B TaxID=1907390 RepID=UPI00095DD408|nr:SDR family oxidoreductase [Microbacterium sp. RU33B]SIT71044.1 Nucleoside-diphosphate-sugar epimerase [Microbacterium sp. RU33B]
MASILYLGGTGVISRACVRRSLDLGHDVSILTRGRSSLAGLEGVKTLVGDLRDPESVRAAIGSTSYDAVAQFVAFTPEHITRDIDVFEGRTGQYVFISSASAYEKPPKALPITESTPLRNPFWQYSRDKIACEDLLVAAFRDRGFPATIVRPSHTYDQTHIPTLGQGTDIERMRSGRPVIVHGDGTTQWTLTHSDDVAVGIAGLLSNPLAIGEAFTITGTHAPTWNQIYRWLAEAAGAPDAELVHVSSQAIAAFAPDLADGLLGDRSHSMVFDTAKITQLVPDFRTTITFDEGARRVVAWYDAHPHPGSPDSSTDAVFDRLVDYARSAGA